ncbi:MAG: thioredoxin domain-containing protein [Acidobacteriota bacterium]|nr:thioredoxin domain-containing protein [Acidobacteriota bacterium]
MSFRKLALPFFASALCLAGVAWQTVADPPGVDWHGLTGAKRDAALKFLRTEGCTCGCNKKLAECRVTDSTCTESRKLSGVVTKAFSEGKSADAVRVEVGKVATEPPPVLDEPVKISTEGDPVRGPEKARITIVEFSDFQCPFCSKAVAEAKEIMRQMPNDVRLVFKQFPLDSHSQAEFGAEASLAAQAQGKFWEMHDLLYAGFPDLSRAKVMTYARELKLDIPRFTADLASHKYRARTHAEEQQGEVAGVSGTPSFFFNGRHYNGTFDAASVVPLLKKELK